MDTGKTYSVRSHQTGDSEILYYTNTEWEDVCHGFFGNTGGVSTGCFASLNGGARSGETPANIQENRRRALEALGMKDDACLIGMHQIHSNRAVVVSARDNAYEWPEADGLVTRDRGVGLMVLTADCAPVLFREQRSGIIGAAHAGWRGALGGVLESVVECMVKLGAKQSRIEATIGPCIAAPSYEVDHRFREEMISVDPRAFCFFSYYDSEKQTTPPLFCFDLPKYVSYRLSFLFSRVTLFQLDTFSGPFFSRRRMLKMREESHGNGMSMIFS